MAIVINSGLLAAVEDVRTFFAANGVTANVQIGWKPRAHQNNQGPGGANRVVFTPSGDDTGAGGNLSQPAYVGDRPIIDPATDRVVATLRPLIDWERPMLVSVWARDALAPESETAQIEATEDLFEWVVRATRGATGAFASLQWTSAKWTVPGERSYGLELRAAFTYRHPIFDVPVPVFYPTRGAVGRAAPPSPPDPETDPVPPIGGDT